MAVFLPLGFAGGLVSQFFLPFALTVTFALLASLVVALTVIPVLAFFLVRAPNGEIDPSGSRGAPSGCASTTPPSARCSRSRSGDRWAWWSGHSRFS